MATRSHDRRDPAWIDNAVVAAGSSLRWAHRAMPAIVGPPRRRPALMAATRRQTRLGRGRVATQRSCDYSDHKRAPPRLLRRTRLARIAGHFRFRRVGRALARMRPYLVARPSIDPVRVAAAHRPRNANGTYEYRSPNSTRIPTCKGVGLVGSDIAHSRRPSDSAAEAMRFVSRARRWRHVNQEPVRRTNRWRKRGKDAAHWQRPRGRASTDDTRRRDKES